MISEWYRGTGLMRHSFGSEDLSEVIVRIVIMPDYIGVGLGRFHYTLYSRGFSFLSKYPIVT